MNRHRNTRSASFTSRTTRLLLSLGLSLALFLLIAVRSLPAQGPIFRANTREVSVVFRVVDKNNRPVPGLTRDEIHVEDEGVQRKLTSFAGDVAYAQVVVAADVSGSMSTVLEPLQGALNNFADRISEDADRQPGDVLLSLLPFSDTARMLVDRTPDPREFKEAVARLRPSGSTSLVDAILSTLLNAFGEKAPSPQHISTATAKDDTSLIPSEFRRRPSAPSAKMTSRPKFLVIFTDAGENSSAHQWSDIASALLGKEIVIYSVVFDSGTPDSNVPKLTGITKDSGGKVYRSKADDLKSIYEQIAKDIRSRYVLTFSASDVQNPRIWRNIQILTTRPGLSILARSGYCPESPCQKSDGSFVGGQPKNWNDILTLNRDSQVVSSVKQHLQSLQFTYSRDTEKIISDLRERPVIIEKRWNSSEKNEKPTFVAHQATDKSHSINVDTEACGVALAPENGGLPDHITTAESPESAGTKSFLAVLNPEIRVSRRPGSGQQMSSDDSYFQSQALFYLADPSGRVPWRLRVQCNRPHFLVSDDLVQLAVQSLAQGLKLKAEESSLSGAVGSSSPPGR
jgi:VWFA-related protein